MILWSMLADEEIGESNEGICSSVKFPEPRPEVEAEASKTEAGLLLLDEQSFRL